MSNDTTAYRPSSGNTIMGWISSKGWTLIDSELAFKEPVAAIGPNTIFELIEYGLQEATGAMFRSLKIMAFSLLIPFSCRAVELYDHFPDAIHADQRYVIYSHGLIVEGNDPKPISPKFGQYVSSMPEYPQVAYRWWGFPAVAKRPPMLRAISPPTESIPHYLRFAPTEISTVIRRCSSGATYSRSMKRRTNWVRAPSSPRAVISLPSRRSRSPQGRNMERSFNRYQNGSNP